MAEGTHRPEAIVCGSGQGSALSLTSWNALTIGSQPDYCVTIIFCRRAPTQPRHSISEKAFHIPISPVPPPVG